MNLVVASGMVGVQPELPQNAGLIGVKEHEMGMSTMSQELVQSYGENSK